MQSGSRVAALPIGKGCRLLYATHGVFVSSTPDAQDTGSTSNNGGSGGATKQPLSFSREKKKGPRVRDAMLVLSPDGTISTVAVPFPALVRYIVPLQII